MEVGQYPGPFAIGHAAEKHRIFRGQMGREVRLDFFVSELDDGSHHRRVEDGDAIQREEEVGDELSHVSVLLRWRRRVRPPPYLTSAPTRSKRGHQSPLTFAETRM